MQIQHGDTNVNSLLICHCGKLTGTNPHLSQRDFSFPCEYPSHTINVESLHRVRQRCGDEWGCPPSPQLLNSALPAILFVQ